MSADVLSNGQPHASRMKRSLSKDDETNGFLSSIFSAAQNAATIIGAKSDDEDDEKRLNFRLKFNLDISPYQSPLEPAEVNKSALSSIPVASTKMSTDTDLAATDSLLASVVQFSSVRDSPVNAMGDGNLTLQHFDEKEANSKTVGTPQLEVNGKAMEEANRSITITGNNDNQVVRRRSFSRSSINDVSRENSDEDDGDILVENMEDDVRSEADENDDDALYDLEHMLDSASITEASTKKNKEFHATFRHIPASEHLIGAYSCALSKDILVQGRLYLSPNFLCFNSNILGWVTNLIIPFREVIQIEKKSTAVLFPNGIVIRTLHQKYVFASFMSRDTTFNLIMKIWHNFLQQTITEENGSIRRSNTISRGRPRNSKYTADENGLTNDNATKAELDSIAATDSTSEDALSRQPTRSNSKRKSKANESSDTSSKLELPLSEEELSDDTEKDGDDKSKADSKGSKFGNIPNPGPATHEPTSNGYVKDANDVDIIEHTFKAPLGVVFTILFGSDNSHFVKILKSQKNFDIETSKITGLSTTNKERNYSYIKPLSGSIGPKQTKCLVTDTLKVCDFSKAVEVEQTTSTPDVPSGNSFKVLTKIFFNWGSNNCTKMKVVTVVEWSARSWIKGPVERGSIDGQKDFMKGLVSTVTEIINTESQAGTTKTKRKKAKSISIPMEQKDEPVPEPPKELTLGEQLSSLLESIGKLLPFEIPMISHTLSGGIVVLLASFAYSFILVWLLGGNASKVSVDLPSEDSGSRVVYLNDKKYFLMPSLDTYLTNAKRRAKSEVKMWKSIRAKEDRASKYEDPELEEVVKLAREKMEHIYHQLNI